MDEVAPWTEGESLIGVANQEKTRGPVAIEYAAEASYAPVVALRDGDYKYVRCALDPVLLFNLTDDPHELTNLVDDPAHATALSALQAMADSRWNLERFDKDVRRSQAQRWVVYEALRNGCLLYTSPSPRDQRGSRMPSSA